MNLHPGAGDTESPAPSEMSKLHQIYESDLAELEQILPQLSEALMTSLDNRLRVKLRRCQTILSNVRWNYGPASHVEVIQPPDGPPPPATDLETRPF